MDLKKIINKIISEEVKKNLEENLKNQETDCSECQEGETYEEMIDRLDGMIGEEEDFDNEELNEGKQLCECGGELSEGLCLECGKTLNENDSFIKDYIHKLVKESIPGLSVTKRSQDQSKKDSEDHLSDVNKKMKSQKIEDITKEKTSLPTPNEGKKVARKNTDEQDEIVADNRGYGIEDVKFDNEPSETFKKRMEMSIKGDRLMGNSDEYVNTIKSDLGSRILKKVERKKEKEEDMPMYIKDPQPVNEEMDRMKEMMNYNKKTQ